MMHRNRSGVTMSQLGQGEPSPPTRRYGRSPSTTGHDRCTGIDFSVVPSRGMAVASWASFIHIKEREDRISEATQDGRLASLLGRSAIERPLPATADRQGVPHCHGLLVLLRRW